MSEQPTDNWGQTDADGSMVQQDVAVVRSLLSVDQDRRLAVVVISTTGEEARTVRVTETVPETHTVAFAGEGGRSASGTITVEGTVGPETPLRFGYVLVGPTATELPSPTVELLGETTADGVRATIQDGEGEATPLALRSEELFGQSQLRLPVLSLAESAADAESATRSMDGAAVGVVMTPTNEDAALRTALRASQRGHSVFVTYTGVTESNEMLSKLSSLGAVIVDPPAGAVSQSQLHRRLSAAAREQGLPGIVLQTRDCPRIDYDRTAEAYGQSDYEVVAIPESWSTPTGGLGIVVGIPAYNAESSIAGVVERVAAFADEVVVVDDGSSDGTAVRAREAGASVVRHEMNRGYGGALKTLFRTADDREAAHLVVIDADGQHDPADIPMLIETQERDGTDIVIGSRYVGERDTRIPFVRSLGLAVINGLTNASMGRLRPSGFVHDTQSGYRAYTRRAVHSLAGDPMIGNNMGASTDILYHAHRARLSVGEVPTTIYYDVENSSSQGSLSHGFDLLRNIAWTVEYGRPMLVVGGPGMVSTVLGVGVTVFLLTTFLETGTLAAHQLLISVLFALGGLLMCIAAILMHVLNVHPTMRRLSTDGNN